MTKSANRMAATENDQDGKAGVAVIMWIFGIPLPFILLYWIACN
jgi:hypothetical protein